MPIIEVRFIEGVVAPDQATKTKLIQRLIQLLIKMEG